MTLEVIGAGLGRTGTMTLKIALEKLGFGPCHHMAEVLNNPDQIPFWNRVVEGGEFDWEEVYGAYKATVDWPGCHFYRELAARYPDAKVILSRRDPERWYESMNETILNSLRQRLGPDGTGERADEPMRFATKIIAQDMFEGDFSKENVIAAFNRHERNVREAIPAERLLVFEAKDGWEPLCSFLEVPVPTEPFPRTNNRTEYQELAQQATEISAGSR